jgi:2Fe-2S iron-sulfur cluster binding domain
MRRVNRDQRASVSVTLNGRRLSAEAEPRMSLSDFIRHALSATGTHVGCEHGVCGACTVLLDGVAVRSCLTLAVQADGREITTVEALATDGALNPAAILPQQPRPAMRLLHAGDPDVVYRFPAPQSAPLGGGSRGGLERSHLPVHRLRRHHRRRSRSGGNDEFE